MLSISNYYPQVKGTMVLFRKNTPKPETHSQDPFPVKPKRQFPSYKNAGKSHKNQEPSRSVVFV
jgi:hypothetical protein